MKGDRASVFKGEGSQECTTFFQPLKSDTLLIRLNPESIYFSSYKKQQQSIAISLPRYFRGLRDTYQPNQLLLLEFRHSRHLKTILDFRESEL